LAQLNIAVVNALVTVIAKKILNRLDLVTLQLLEELAVKSRKQQFIQHFARLMKDGIILTL